jgi:hypothetical protein
VDAVARGGRPSPVEYSNASSDDRTAMKSLAAFVVFATACAPGWAQGTLTSCRAIADPANRLACYDALEAEAAANTSPAKAAVPAAASPTFGLPAQPAPAQPEAIESRIEGPFSGWRQGQQIRLANGQVWQVMDSGSAVIDATDPKVRIRRGALGAYYLDFETSNRSPRVRRLQ